MEYATIKSERLTRNKRSHIWTGSDTKCRLHSTGGIGKEMEITKEPIGKICSMCRETKQQPKFDNIPKTD